MKFNEVLSRETPKIIVAHPGTQHSYQTAFGIQEAGMLQRYMTSFYYKKLGFVARFISFLPARFMEKIKREFLRRRKEELDDSLIQTFPIPELIYLLSTKAKILKNWSNKILYWRNKIFDEKIARMVLASRPDAVICYDSCSIQTFKACKNIGSIAILDQSIGHIKTGVNILHEEALLHPEFADTLATNTPDWLIEQCTLEALAADKIMVASEYVKESLIKNGVSPLRIIINPYGADITRFYPALKRDENIFRILFVGAIGQRKGIKYLLEAFKRLRLPNAELVLVGGIVGSGIGLEPYRGLFRHVQNVPHHEVHTVFQSADIFVYPSLHEGSALAIYEALASGLPVVTTPNAGSVVRDGEEGFIVPIRDIDTLMAKILLLYQNEDLRVKMSQQARKRAESFTWQTYRLRLAQIVQGFVEDKEI
ncbi:MAG: glycosyltransferase family 4 protein [Candidatus Riflebacteria bacterium]|nr:glycosyltransferase family 4 protein [Candidatus Riflebacteria bacterium]